MGWIPFPQISTILSDPRRRAPRYRSASACFNTQIYRRISYMGDGKDSEQSKMAFPVVRGQVMIFSRKVVTVVMNEAAGSNGCCGASTQNGRETMTRDSTSEGDAMTNGIQDSTSLDYPLGISSYQKDPESRSKGSNGPRNEDEEGDPKDVEDGVLATEHGCCILVLKSTKSK